MINNLVMLVTVAGAIFLASGHVRHKFTEQELQAASSTAVDKLMKTHLFSKRVKISASNGAIHNGRTPSASALEKSKRAEIALKTISELANLKGVPVNTITEDDELFRTVANCPVDPITCGENELHFRTADGSCNNFANPTWGQAEIPYKRVLDPDYDDCFYTPRAKGVDGNLLPSARKVSSMLINNDNHLLDDFTAMVTQWGQFIDHDIGFTPATTGVTCCGTDTPDTQCLPIAIPEDDEVFCEDCMEFARSLAAQPDCTQNTREQMNQITAYIDGSMVYGSNSVLAANLRTMSGGKLRIHQQGTMELLPQTDVVLPACDTNPMPCFKAGDVRVNETPDLVTMHTLFLREHNRIALALSVINPHWIDERLYQVSREIVGAELQHITLNEWLPIIVGRKYARENGLLPRSPHYSYNSNIDASVTNEFATAAFRYGHSMITDMLELFGKNYVPSRNIPLSSVAFAPGFIYENEAPDEVLRGLVTQQCQAVDVSFGNEVHTKLFSRNESTGLDLVSLNLQRGRDHGLKPYIDYREDCGFPAVTNIAQLAPVLGPENVAALGAVYDSVKDIDLFIGGLMEPATDEALIGETFQCIIGDQFKRLKEGDRFFYENKDTNAQFTPPQLSTIRGTLLSDIICANADNIDSVQKDVFTVSSSRIPCHSMNGINLSKWFEVPSTK